MVCRKITMVLVCVMMLTGCAVGPDFKSPEPPTAQAYTAVALPQTTEAVAVAAGTPFALFVVPGMYMLLAREHKRSSEKLREAIVTSKDFQ